MRDGTFMQGKFEVRWKLQLVYKLVVWKKANEIMVEYTH